MIQGNYIGTDVTGMQPLGNNPTGITLRGGGNNVVGGTTPGAGNVISANTRVSFNAGSYIETYQLSTIISAQGGNVICERAMYGNNRAWGTDSIASYAGSTTWYLAEGCTDVLCHFSFNESLEDLVEALLPHLERALRVAIRLRAGTPALAAPE